MSSILLRLRLRTMLAAVALMALLLWAGVWLWSPLHRLSAALRPDQPAYLRREAAVALGSGVPRWEVDEAVSLLIRTLNDPSPRVRECAAAGLAQHQANARIAIPALLKLADDQDRWVRASAMGAIGAIEEGNEANPEALQALQRGLEDSDADVRLMAADALVKIGEIRPIASVLVAAMTTPEHQGRAKLILSRAGAARKVLMPEFAKLVTDSDPRRRDAALGLLIDHGGSEIVKSALQIGLQSEDATIRQWSALRMERLEPSP